MTPDNRKWNEADADAVRRVAVPIMSEDGEFDPMVVLDWVGHSGVIGLGEPTHGDAETLALKQAIIQGASGQVAGLLVAWERGVGHIEHIAAHLREHGSIAAAERRWVYPWVSKEAEDLFRWIACSRTEQNNPISFCGVDMDGLAPAQILTGVAERLSLNDDPAWINARNLVDVLRRSAPEEDACRNLHDALTHVLGRAHVSHSLDHLVLEATRQWAEFNLITLSVANASNDSVSRANAFRDTCMSENLAAQLNIHQPDLAIFSAHNGHVSRDAKMAGGRFMKTSDRGYTAIGVSFARGTFNAGTGHENGFDPKLRAFDAAEPPPGSLEDLLLQSGLTSACIDLRKLRGASHPLARKMLMREASLAGGQPQFEMRQVPAEYYDILIWLDEISASRIQRTESDYW